jgi:hypothetical protein
MWRRYLARVACIAAAPSLAPKKQSLPLLHQLRTIHARFAVLTIGAGVAFLSKPLEDNALLAATEAALAR